MAKLIHTDIPQGDEVSKGFSSLRRTGQRIKLSQVTFYRCADRQNEDRMVSSQRLENIFILRLLQALCYGGLITIFHTSRPAHSINTISEDANGVQHILHLSYCSRRYAIPAFHRWR